MDDEMIKILLVEDNGDIAENICLYLENVGHTVDYAATGAQALALAEGQRYDALIVDIMLPGMDGLTLCKRLRDERNLETPVLMLTAAKLAFERNGKPNRHAFHDLGIEKRRTDTLRRAAREASRLDRTAELPGVEARHVLERQPANCDVLTRVDHDAAFELIFDAVAHFSR